MSKTQGLGQCPYCSDGNPYTNSVCNGCGARLPWADAFDTQRQAAQAAQRQAAQAAQQAQQNAQQVPPQQAPSQPQNVWNKPLFGTQAKQPAPVVAAPQQSNWASSCGVLFFIFIVLPWSCSLFNSGPSRPVSTPSAIPSFSSSHSVAYRVTGTASKVSLTYNNAQGGSEQISSAAVPWFKQFSAESGTFLYVSAQNSDESGGTVHVEIIVDGSPVRQSDASGFAAIADCNGSL